MLASFKFVTPKILSNREVAHELASAGVRTFPCVGETIEGRKKAGAPCPGIMWREVPIGDHGLIDAWWDRFPDAVPGMSLEAQGIFVIDTDGDEGRRQWADRCRQFGGDGDGPRTLTPNGVHVFYKVPEGIQITNGIGSLTPKALGGRIDVRGPGYGYVIAPGAERATGEHYTPLGGNLLSFLDAKEPPQWVIDTLTTKPARPAPANDDQAELRPTAWNSRAVENPRIKAWAETAFEREISLLANCGEGGRNAQLNQAAMACYQLVAGGFLDEGQVHAALIDAAIRCGLDQDDGRKQTERTIASGKRAGLASPRKPPQAIMEDEALEDYGRAVSPPMYAQAADGTTYDAETGEVTGAGLDLAQPPFPDHLTRPQGVIGEIVDWIEGSSIKPNRLMALGAAIGVVGTVMGRHWCGPTRATQSLYIIALAPTGAGKDHPMQCAKRIVLECSVGMLGAGEFMSQSAVVKDLLKKPISLCLMDEFGAFLGRINSPRASSFERGVSKELRTLWSTNTNAYSTPSYASRDSEVAYAPQFSIFATTTHEEFFASLNGVDVKNGLLNRFMLFNVAERPQSVEPKFDGERVPPQIVEKLLAIWGGGNKATQAKTLNYTDKPNFVQIPWEAVAGKDLFRSIQADIETRSDAAPQLRDFITRVPETALRLAAINAGGQNPFKPVITIDDLKWGHAVASWSADAMVRAVGLYAADTEHQANANKILRILTEAGGKIERHKLVRTLNNTLKKREIDDILAVLKDGRRIDECKADNPKTRRKVGFIYLLKL